MHKSLLLILALALLWPQTVFAAPDQSRNKEAPAAGIPAVAAPKAAPGMYVPSVLAATLSTEVINFRWAEHTDAVSGISKLRLVFDLSGPAETDVAVTGAPAPRLTVTLKDAIPSVAMKSSTEFDGRYIHRVSVRRTAGAAEIAIDLPVMVDDSDYRVFTLAGDPLANKPFRLVIDINKMVVPLLINYSPGLKNKLIVLDPGHGGSDPGAIGAASTPEKTVNLAVALQVRSMLEKAGAKVLMTRQDDRDVASGIRSAAGELQARVDVANGKKADAFVSIHSNSFHNRAAGGTSVYYYQKTVYDSLLASSIHGSVKQACGLQDRGVNHANFYVVKRTAMPAALVELAFISNPEEEKLLNSPAFQQQIAGGIVQGLDRFFTLASKQGGALK